MRAHFQRGLGAALVLALAAAAAAQSSAEALFRKGFRAQRGGRHVEAYVLYNRARALDPANRKYIRAARQVREYAAQSIAAAGDYAAALAVAPAAAGLQRLADQMENEPDGAHPAVSAWPPERRLQEPVRLEPDDRVTSFRFRGTLGEAYEQIAAEFGLEAVFDEDFDGGAPVRVDLADCDFSCVMAAMRDVGRTLVVPIAEKRFLVAEDSAVKRRDLEPSAFVTIPLNDAVTPEQVTQIGQAVQQALDLKRFQMSPTYGVLFTRDTASKARMAQAMVAALMHPRGAVAIELRLLAVNRERTAELGIDLPGRFPVTNFSTILNGMPPEPDGSAPLIGIGGGKTVLGVTVGNVRALASVERGSGRSLQTMSVRAEHGMPAEIKIGERYPIITAQFSAAPSTGTDDGNFSLPIPSFTFEDLGLNMRVTPLVHSAGEVTLELETEFRLLAGGAVNDVPILSNRQFQSSVRLSEGEFAIVSGMAVLEQRNTRAGQAGLADVPLLRKVFGRSRRHAVQSELLILVRPRIVRLPPAEAAPSLTFRFGPEQRPLPAL